MESRVAVRHGAGAKVKLQQLARPVRELRPASLAWIQPLVWSAMDWKLLIDRMRPLLAARPGVAVAWLFGSAARGAMRPDSDVDVAIVFADGLPDAERERLLVDLSSRLEGLTSPQPIDVVALEDQGPVFIHRALKDGMRIVVNDEERRVDFESDALVRYLAWKPTWDLAAKEQQQGLRRWLEKYRRA